MGLSPLFSNTLNKWGTPDFKTAIKLEIEKLSCDELPLQQGLTSGSYALENDLEAMILHMQESETSIQVKAGIFYKAIIAGCSCSDDPTPIDECNEYCEVMIEINRESAEMTIKHLPN